MAYSENAKSTELDELTALDANDVFIVGDYSDSGRAKKITKTNIGTTIDDVLADSSTTVKGLVKMSTAPASATEPIAVGDNDARIPTTGENDALAGGSTFGTPSSTNKFITQDYNSSATGLPVVRTYLNAASPATWTKPAGLKYVVVEVQAGGGGGGGLEAPASGNEKRGGGGGSGGYSKKLIAVASLGATETVTIGAAGTAGSSGNGGAGGNSSFGTHATTTGGAGGVGSSSGSGSIGAGGAGGTASSGDINISGQNGERGFSTDVSSGAGGSSLLGAGGQSVKDVGSGAVGENGSGYGSGGSGGVTKYDNGAKAGGAGAAGIVIVTEYFS